MNMRALSLFSGCGGLDLAAEMGGIEIAGQCEIEEACNRVLRHWWPDTPRWRDIHDVTADSVKERCGDISLVFGGFPCQPHSLAGRRKGSRDERDLWPELRRVLRDVKPRWFVGENVPGILSNENGRFFGAVLRDLAALGYNVGWGVWGACDVGAPHKRERVFIVAYHPGVGRGTWRPEQPGQQGVCQSARSGSRAMADTTEKFCDWSRQPRRGREGLTDGGAVGNASSEILRDDLQNDGAPDRKINPFANTGTCGGNKIMGYPGGAGQQEYDAASVTSGAEYATGQCSGGAVGHSKRCGLHQRAWRRTGSETADGCAWDGRSAQPGVGGVFDGFSCGLDFPGWPAGRVQEQYPWEPPRVVPGKSVTGRTSRIKMLGNAVVRQQAAVLFMAIMEIERWTEA